MNRSLRFVRFAVICALALTALAPSFSALAASENLSRRERKQRMASLEEKYKNFLEQVEPIITKDELNIFLRLESNAQRDAFIDKFWERRDPDPRTPGNEYRDRYGALREEAIVRYRNLNNDRAQTLLHNGEPAEVVIMKGCRWLQDIEIWIYDRPIRNMKSATLVFYSRQGATYRLWDALPSFDQSLVDLLNVSGLSEGVERVFFAHADEYGRFEPALIERCTNGTLLLRALNWGSLFSNALAEVVTPSPINEEDVERFLDSTILEDSTDSDFEPEVTIDFPSRSGTRTAVRVTMVVPKEAITAVGVDGEDYFAIDLIGETIYRERVFERFRYRFDYPAREIESGLPVVVERLLNPGEYELRLKVSDGNSDKLAVVIRTIEVPMAGSSTKSDKGAIIETPATAPADVDDTVRLATLPDSILTGNLSVEAIVSGKRISGIEFYLDGRKIMTKRRPPWTLELDLGRVPRPHRVRVIGVDRRGEPVDGDEIVVNAGVDPFRARIVSPRFRKSVSGLVRVEMEVSGSEKVAIEKVDLYLNDQRVATLYEPPWVQTVAIGDSGELLYLRMVATPSDPAMLPAEDVVVLNAPQYLEQIDVRLIEVPVTVFRGGRPVPDLPETAFHLFDDGVETEIARFEYIRNLPLSVGIAIDSSASMRDKMDQARSAGVAFLRNILEEGDRAFIVSFDRDAYLTRDWTSSIEELERSLAGLRAEESTALYDAILQSLYRFEGVRGQKAVVLLSDGADTSSRFDYDQAIEYARRRGIPIYVIGIGLGVTDVDARLKLGHFASETGGAAWFVRDPAELTAIYAQIENELRSQYLLSFYPPSDVEAESGWREIRVNVDGCETRAISGYYP